MGQTFVEKVLAKKAGLDRVDRGEIVEVAPDVALSHDNAAPIYGIFQKMGAKRVIDPDWNVVEVKRYLMSKISRIEITNKNLNTQTAMDFIPLPASLARFQVF
jgi:homoaconitase/3-isopropylmalate dehydratase large subunit